MNVKDEKYYFVSWMNDGSQTINSACFTVHPFQWLREYHAEETNKNWPLSIIYWKEITKEEYGIWLGYFQERGYIL